MACKGYACSHRIYENLKKLFSDVTDKGALRDFNPVDVEFSVLVPKKTKQNKVLPQIAATHSFIYRVKSPSFHAIGPESYANKHYRFHDYFPEKPTTCCWGHTIFPNKMVNH
jgi:hypothetical protein